MNPSSIDNLSIRETHSFSKSGYDTVSQLCMGESRVSTILHVLDKTLTRKYKGLNI